MRKINLNMKYERHYDVIKSVVDKNKKATKAAIELGISLDHIYRLIKKYKLEGKQRFMHRNTGKTPINQLSLELKKKSVF